MSSARPRFVPWIPEEDERLASVVTSCGSKICWKKVAASMPGRNNKSCRKRWLHSLDPNLRKGRWTSEEDAALLESVEKHGKRWYEVAKALPGRTDDQCAKRYKEAVDPSIRRDPWTAEEDEQLWSAFGKHGNRWHAIANTLQGRPAIHCRNRLQSLQRVRAAADDAASPSPSESSSGMESLPSPSLPGSPIRSPPSSSGPVYDRESDSRFGLEVPPETPQDESFRIPTQALQQGFPITAPIPTDDPVGCWRETIPPNEFSVGGNVQFYQPPQVLATHLNPPTFNNSSPNPPVPFTMTCPVPHCCYQCQAVAEIWRHMTWTHIRPQPEDGIEGIVEKVVLGNV